MTARICLVDAYSRKIIEGLRIPKELLYGDSQDLVSSLVKQEILAASQPLKKDEIFEENMRVVLRRRIRRKRKMIQNLGVNVEGITSIIGCVGCEFQQFYVEVVENFVGEPYYMFLYDGKDLFDGR